MSDLRKLAQAVRDSFTPLRGGAVEALLAAVDGHDCAQPSSEPIAASFGQTLTQHDRLMKGERDGYAGLFEKKAIEAQTFMDQRDALCAALDSALSGWAHDGYSDVSRFCGARAVLENIAGPAERKEKP